MFSEIGGKPSDVCVLCFARSLLSMNILKSASSRRCDVLLCFSVYRPLCQKTPSNRSPCFREKRWVWVVSPACALIKMSSRNCRRTEDLYHFKAADCGRFDTKTCDSVEAEGDPDSHRAGASVEGLLARLVQARFVGRGRRRIYK